MIKNKYIKVELIKEYIKENKISKTKFCKLCNISLTTYNKIMQGDDNFGLIAIFKIAKLLKRELKEMFVE